MIGDLTKGSVIHKIISFSIPVLLGNLLQQLYNMVDSIIVGRFVGVDAFAAVGSTGSLNFLILGFALGVSSGLCIPIAQRFGAKDYSDMRRKIAVAIYIAAGVTIILTIITALGAGTLLRWMQTPDNIFEDARIYITILFIGIPATILYNLPANILRSLGDSKSPIYFLIISAILNLVLDLLFVAAFQWGVAGSAIATVISQGVSGIMCIIYMIRKYPILKFCKAECIPATGDVQRSISIGIPMGLQFSITAVGSVILQSAVNSLGSDVVASVSAAMKLQMIIMQPFEAIGVTMATFSGQNLGAGKIKRIREGVKKALFMTIILSVISFITINALASPASLLFMSKEEMTPMIRANIKQLLLINSFSYFFLGSLLILRNTLQGLGRSVIAMGAGLFEMVARSLVAFLLVGVFGFFAVCFAHPAAWVAANIILVPMYYITFKKLDKRVDLSNIELEN